MPQVEQARYASSCKLVGIGGQGGIGRKGLRSSHPQGQGVLFSGESQLSIDSVLLLGEGDRNRLGQVWSRSPEAILIGLPLDDVDVVVGSDVLVGSPHDDDVGVTDELELSDGLLLDAVLALEGVVPVVVAGAGSGGIVDAEKMRLSVFFRQSSFYL
jgi:hypothetical protein